MSDKLRVSIEFTAEDTAYLNAYRESVEMLYGVVIEIMTIHTGMLLSPVFREMILKQAQEVERKHKALRLMLYVDNPGKSLGGEA